MIQSLQTLSNSLSFVIVIGLSIDLGLVELGQHVDRSSRVQLHDIVAVENPSLIFQCRKNVQ